MTRTSRIVVVEDEPAIRRGVIHTLQLHGYQVVEAADGLRAQAEAVRPEVDLLLLDLMLPRRDGLEILRHVRQVRPHLPVIILTARGSEEDRVRGLTMGADDYVIKPFSARELLAQIEAVLRRTQNQHDRVRRARLGTATIDLDREPTPGQLRRSMTALPLTVELPEAMRIADPGWTGLRLGLLFAWASALVALLVVGLGLSLARRWAGAMGGTLTVHSRAQGGACFRRILPQPPVTAPSPNGPRG